MPGNTTIAHNENSSTNNTMTTHSSSAELPKCMICLEPDNDNTWIKIGTNCPHVACRACLRTYLVHCENDRKESAVCPDPDCHKYVTRELARTVLGREYTPKTWNKPPQDTAIKEGPDALLGEWLKENGARECENCGAFIVREEGCDAMQCLCGWRFCYLCCMDANECDCRHPPDEFYDNILGYDTDNVPELATDEDLEDFAAFIRQRRVDVGDEDEESERENIENAVVSNEGTQENGNGNGNAAGDEEEKENATDRVLPPTGTVTTALLNPEGFYTCEWRTEVENDGLCHLYLPLASRIMTPVLAPTALKRAKTWC